MNGSRRPGETGSSRPSGWIQTFAETLDLAITQQGKKLEALQRRLAERGFTVSTATLSYWRTGRSTPSRPQSLRALPHLEEILDLPPGHLTKRLPPGPNRSRTAQPAQLPRDVDPVVRACLDELGLGLAQELVEVSVQVTVDVDAHGSIRAYTFRNLVRAAHDGAQRTASIVADSDRRSGPELFAGPGCHIGRTVRLPLEGVYVAEVVLDRPMIKDSLTILKHGERFDPGAYTEQFMTYCPVRRLSEVVMWIRFDPDHLPTSVVTFREDAAGEVAMETPLIGTTAHLALLNFGPGEMGLRWSW